MTAWLGRAQDLALPPRCVLCLDPGQRPALDLCAGCESDLPRHAPGCPRCAAPPGVAGAPCVECARAPSPFARVVAAYRYDWPVAELVREFKYHGRLTFGRVLGTLVARHAAGARDGAPLPACLVPVPLHPRRERERGFNQAEALAVAIGRRLGVPVAADLCARVRDTRPQASLDAAARATNLDAAFALRRPPAVRRVALVDDVLTTGTTLRALATVFAEAGVETIEAWVVARA